MKARYRRTTNQTLTPREREIYNLIVTSGAHSVNIAKDLGIRYDTMRAHLQNIFAKTGAESAIQLVVWHYTKPTKGNK